MVLFIVATLLGSEEESLSFNSYSPIREAPAIEAWRGMASPFEVVLLLLQVLFDDPCLEMPAPHEFQILYTMRLLALSDIPRSRAISDLVLLLDSTSLTASCLNSLV